MTALYHGIAADITRNCNLRCPFCLSDFSEYKPKGLIEDTTFDKLMSLLPLVEGPPSGEATVLLSCLYEPSIHPRWLDLYERVPEEHRKKCMFTTNLARITDEEIDRLARLEFHHVNISVDSFVPEVYEGLRKGARFAPFMEHFTRLTTRMREDGATMGLHCVTVVTRENAAEVPEIVKRCAEEFGAKHHEVRAIYEIPHIDEGWKRSNVAPDEVWPDIQAFVAETPYSVSLEVPPESYYRDDAEPYSKTGEPPPKPEIGGRRFPLSLRFRSDGLVNLYAKDMYFDIDALEDPAEFFRSAAPVFLADRELVQPGTF